jgi:translocation and assembly module TamB
LSYDLKKVLAEGALHGECKDISVVASLLGKEVRGSAEIDAKFNPSKGMNVVNLNLQAQDISGKFGKAGGLDMKLKLFGDFKSPDITMAVSLRGFENNKLLLKTIDLTATGNTGNLLFTIKGTGRAVYDMKIESAGKISISSSVQSLTFDWLRGEYEDIPVNLTKPLNIIRSEKIIELKPMELNLSGGKLSASGTLSDESLNLNLNVNEIPASLLHLAGVSELDGTATGSITLSGMLQSPEARVQLILNDLRLHDPQYANLPPFKLTLMSEFKSSKLHTDLSLVSSMGNPFILEMDIPLTLSFSPLAWSIPEDGLLKGRMSGKIDLENIASLTGLYNQVIAGSLDMNFDLGGTIKSPIVTGHAVLDNGTYENMSIGAEIKNIKADISSDASRFILNQISGEDGKDGVVTGKGWIEFAPAKDFPFEVSLNLKKVVVIRGESSTVTASGNPSLSGNFKDNTLKGNLTVDRGDFSIPERLPVGITVLEVKEINGPEQEQPKNKSTKKSIMKLDLSIKSEGQLFLTGRGLNSEWRGNLTLKGSIMEPVITGRLSVLRGNYNFLGKRFTLTNGVIDLDGRYPLSPNMEVTGSAVASKITAIINLSGDVRKPQITLTSEPIMPSDEILSQLLFGQEVSKISPLQAIELANALNTMVGKGNYDIVGKTKKILGVDQLEVKQSADNATESSVSVGKYLSDSVYIEVEKGLGAQSSKASVTWEVTPNISIDTDIGGNTSSATSTGTSTGVGINWKWDY